MTAPDRCPTCDREECDRAVVPAVGGPAPACARYAVDWRARALAAEARIATVTAAIEHDIAIRRAHATARANGGQTCGTGGTLASAQPSTIAYLERVVRDLHDDRPRVTVVDAVPCAVEAAP